MALIRALLAPAIAAILAAFAAPGAALAVEGAELLSRLGGELSFVPPGFSAPVSGAWRADLGLALPASGDAENPAQGGGAAPVLHLSLDRWDLGESWANGTVTLDAELVLAAEGLQVRRFQVSSPALYLCLGEGALMGRELSLVGSAYQAADSGWRFTDLDLSLSGALTARGNATLAADSGLTLDLSGTIIESGPLLAAFSSVLPQVIAKARAQGGMDYELSLSLPADGPGSTSAHIMPRGLSLAMAGHSPWFSADALDGDLRMDALLAEEGSVTWNAAGELAAQGFSPGLAAFRAEFSVTGDDARLTAERLLISPGSGRFTDQPLAVTGGLEYGRRGSLRTRNLKVAAEGLGTFDAAFYMGQEQGQEQSMGGSFSAQGLDAGRLAAFAARAGGLDFTGWTVSGSVDVNGTLAMADGEPLLNTRLDLASTAFSSPDGALLGDKLGAVLDAEVTLGDATVVDADLTLARGEALLGKYYFNFANAPLALNWRGVPNDDGSWSGLTAQATLGGHGRVQARGSARPGGPNPGFSGHVEITDADLSALFETLVRGPNKLTRRDIAAMSASGGASLSMDVEADAAGAWFEGRLTVADGGFESGGEGENGFTVHEVQLDLPFAYGFGDRAPAGGAAPAGEWGHLSTGALILPVGRVEAMELPLRLSPGSLEIEGALALPVLGGSLELTNVQVRDPLVEDFLLTCDARLEGADLDTITLGEIPLMGELRGDLSPVTLSMERMDAGGELTGSFFLGGLAVRNLSVRKPLTPARSISADVAMEQVDLEQISEATGVGTITGRLNVDIENLVVAYEEPVAFHLTALSEEVDDVDQEISLKAVNSISVMSTGSGLTGVGVGVFASFFETFAYESIGFSLDLQNDVFRVRGLMEEDGIEYLIKKPLFFGINVINMNPENRISFSDMVERLKRVVHPREDKGDRP